MNKNRKQRLGSVNQRMVQQDANTGQTQLELEYFDARAYLLSTPPEPPEPEEEPFCAREFLLSMLEEGDLYDNRPVR